MTAEEVWAVAACAALLEAGLDLDAASKAGPVIERAVRKAVAAEREACAQLADHMEGCLKRFGYPEGAGGFGNRIRYRDEAPDPKVLAKIIRESGGQS